MAEQAGELPRTGLKLLAEDAEDLSVISAALQDAVLKVGDIVYEAGPKRLTLAMNRFRWEGQARRPERVRAALQFGGVLGVAARRVRRDAADAVLCLLAVTFEPAAEPPGGTVVLAFAGDADLRAEVECLDALLTDLGAPWPAKRRPVHGA